MRQKDIRETELYQEAQGLYSSVRQPGSGQISDAAEVHASPDGQFAVFAGTMADTFEGIPPTHLCQVELVTGDIRVLAFGPNTERLPKYSPDGRLIAFLSDRAKKDDFQLYLLDPVTKAARATPAVAGWVEHLHWSPDGSKILLAVAGHGADVGVGQGAITSKLTAPELPSWMPVVETGDENFRWRRVWIYEVASNIVREVSPANENVWEAVWCGNDAFVAVASPGPVEGLWFSATLKLIDLKAREVRHLYQPCDQLGCPAVSPSGKYLAVVDAICSDRGFVAGDLIVIEIASGKAQRVDTLGVDITYTEWRSDRILLLSGHKGFDTVIGLYDLVRGTFEETWVSRDITTVGRYASASGLNEAGDCVLAVESFTRSPEIGVIHKGEYHVVRSFDLGYAQHSRAIDSIQCLTWKAPDGLEIQGWLLKPKGGGPYPLILNIHGGPVWQCRPAWLGRYSATSLMLLKRGYAILLPNPRGSTGRGQEFARRVFGDMGGKETNDHLSGIDYLIAQGIADPKRLGIVGGSHGGFMTCWIIGQDSRFAAAVAVAPITNWVSEHLLSNISHFCSVALADRYTNPSGKYFERSPVMHAHKVKTPTLNICGALDRCTPPVEAMQFHNALLENGVKSVLVTYPEEGHGVRKLQAAADYSARVVGWFEEHLYGP